MAKVYDSPDAAPAPKQGRPMWQRGLLGIGLVLGLCVCFVIVAALVNDPEPDTAVVEPEAVEPAILDPEEIAPDEPTAEAALLVEDEPEVIEQAAAPVEEAESVVELPPYEILVAETEDLTDAQRNAYLNDLVGGRVVGWTARVCDVTETFGTYRVRVTLDTENNAAACIPEARWEVSEEAALLFSREQTVTFTGTVESINELMGFWRLNLQDVEVQ